jgi:hypothetical protein
MQRLIFAGDGGDEGDEKKGRGEKPIANGFRVVIIIY